MAEPNTTRESVWHPVVGYEETYLVSSDGLVRRNTSSKTLRPATTEKGYKYVGLCVNTVVKCHKVHKLVIEAFLHPRPPGMTINHKDGDKANNHIDNLEYLSHAANMRHANNLGLIDSKRARGDRHRSRTKPETIKRGADHPQASLTPEAVRTVLSMIGPGVTHKDIAKRSGVSKTQVARIARGETWLQREGLDR